MRRIGAICAGLLCATSAYAFDLTSLPESAQLTVETTDQATSIALPSGRFVNAALPMIELEGQLRRRAWKIGSADLTTLQILRPLRAEIADAGFEVLLDCASAGCGGFDFRYGVPVLAAPDMNVDLFDFRTIVARRTVAAGVEFIYLMVSRGRNQGFVQLYDVMADQIRVVPTSSGTIAPPAVAAPVVAPTPPKTAPAPETDAESPVKPGSPTSLLDEMAVAGHVILADLEFASGAAQLTDRSYASLTAIAAYLAQNGTARIALVGHTDAVGSLDGNIVLSRKRAQAVRTLLITRHGVNPDQLIADGTGFLAPVASNLTSVGREMNRRVEAVLLTVQ